MSTTTKCTICGNEIEISEAITSELEAKVLKQTQSKHQEEIRSLEIKQELFEKQKIIEIETVKTEITDKAKKEAIEKIRKEYDAKITSTKEESETRDKQNQELNKQLTDLMKQLRESKDTEGKLKLQFEKQLLDEQDNIKQNARKEVEEELSLRLASKDKQLADLDKQLQEAQRKVQQGSQQLQGEVQELALEVLLKKEFIFDEIKEVPKGINGADIVQVVRSNSGITCGTIVWESKNTKSWSQQWILKLKEDTRTLKAEICVLVSSVLPENIKSFGQIDGIWVCDMQTAIPLAFILRDKIMAVKNIQEANKGKTTKAEIVYNYLISNDFKQRIEVWIEYFKSRREELEREKVYFMKKWEKENKSIMRIMHNTAGMYGDLQGLIGAALPKVHYLELPDTADSESNKEIDLQELPF